MTTQGTRLPAGVVMIEDSECPPATLGLWKHYGRKGPAYGIGAGYTVSLSELPADGGSMTKNVSSWVNKTQSDAKLVSSKGTRILKAGESMEEPADHNDTVERVEWV
ncbi:hypothetical protein OH738_01150 [Streptomyces hirsutus]|uniref:Uncharacterized protein n=1 Tax=Streptomyces hirsutus TaxID=35620 RepID=A0ABZ1H0Z6_9ACTN|nr:peptidase inhibitor family I36 protein [Streptomyces hirsutus]WSD11061.1 hypothetical protein OIE73_38900 [Streptomyces hirsutus]WTD15603.1 hypothetical protein OH738_01150 [Streptomyces hirsutus]WTD72923.1 hypothetical protein OHB56_02380 [Streptomyces sp. NBC_01635]